jgi:hypothetical protein
LAPAARCAPASSAGSLVVRKNPTTGDSSRQKRPDQQRGLVLGHLARVGARVDQRRETVRAQRRPGTLAGDPVDHPFGAGHRGLEQVVARAVPVEHHRPVGQQLVPAVLLEPERLGEDPRGKDLGQVGHGVEGAAGHQLGGQLPGPPVEDLLQVGQRARRQRPGHHLAVVGVHRRVDLEQDARLAPRVLGGDVGQADPGGRGEHPGLAQHGVHLLVPGHRVDPVPVEVDDRTGIPNPVQERERVGQEVIAERVDIAARSTHVPVRNRIRHDLSHRGRSAVRHYRW